MTRHTPFVARRRLASLAACLCLLALALPTHLAAAEKDATTPSPPVAVIKPYLVKSPSGERIDNYYWLRDDTRTKPEMLAYLAAENAYADARLAPVKPLEDKVFGEIVSRIKQDDSSVPYLKDGWWYYRRYDTGQEYPVYARRNGSMQAREEIMLDVTRLAQGHDFYQVGEMAVSPDSRLLAYADDTLGRRQYTLRFKDLVTDKTLADAIENVESSLAWTADNRSVLYVEKDPVTLLGLRVRRHVLGTDAAADTLVYEQEDPAFYTSVYSTKDERYLIIYAESTVSTEIRYADAADPKLAFHVFLPRERDHEYQAKHVGDRWIIRTNWQAKNFRLMEARVGEEGDRSKWRELLPGHLDGFVNDFDVFRDFVAVDEHINGLRRIRILYFSGAQDRFIASADPTYTFALADNPTTDTDILRYTYDSLTTPSSTYDYDTRNGQQVLLKRDTVEGGFDAANYVSEYLWATARDGTKVPVSLVYRKGFKPDGSAPLLQLGYGSYGLSSDPDFSVPRLSLLDRGFVFAIAHVRGGDEMGRDWYENGKLLHKRNTFNDFVDVTRFLVREKYADPKRVFAIGGSAGGLLMGAIANEAPQDYKGIVAAVPFVDAVTTMLDESIPLTTNEFDEWGNPKEKQYYDYMLSYSPYDNVARQAYPAMLVTTGLWDSQVQYFEPAKWVAKLRAMKTDSNPLLFRINMEAGHGGKSGRFQRYRETAEEFAFILGEAGIDH